MKNKPTLQKFLDITKITHRFPHELRGIAIQLTLLHTHPHAPSNTYLVYIQSFKKSIYIPSEQIKDHYYPCSWFLHQGKPIAYEFCDESLEFDLIQIQKDLKLIQGKGYIHYGTTVRPIRNETELETKRGHKYVKSRQIEGKVSETATNGRWFNNCSVYCKTRRGIHMMHHSDTSSDD